MSIRLFQFLPILLTLLVGCSSNVLENVRKVTYPPDFNYLSNEKIRGTMQKFAWYTEILDRSLQSHSPPNSQDIELAISILHKLENLSLQLGNKTLTSNHRLISDNIDQFRYSIVSARQALQTSPPNTYAAGKVSAHCLQCHRIGR